MANMAVHQQSCMALLRGRAGGVTPSSIAQPLGLRRCSSAARQARKRKAQARKKLNNTPLMQPPPPASSFPAYSPAQRDFFSFEVLHQSRKSAARVGRIHTPHGVVDTPGFVGVATNGALKALDHGLADAAGLQLMFCNTYHLLLQPGPDVVGAAGGLHNFIGRSQDRPIITDSGGFQVEPQPEPQP